MFRKKLVIIGAGGHAKSVIDIIEELGSWKIIGLIGRENEKQKQVSGYRVIGTDKDLRLIRKECNYAFIGIGQIKNYEPRVSVAKELERLNFKMPAIKAKSAYISKRAIIGKGTLVGHGAIINSGAMIGENAIINSGAIIEHDSKIHDYTHISTGTIVNGGAIVEKMSFLGSNSMVREGVIVPQCSIIRAGSIVMK